MASQPPPLPQQQHSLRLASALNVFLPGAGLIYLGRRVLGAALAGAFLGCFLAVITLFLVGYSRYLLLATDENLMQGNKLEEAGEAFHRNWMAGLALVGGLVYLCSGILFAQAKRRAKAHSLEK
jgi:hypothetical protein